MADKQQLIALVHTVWEVLNRPIHMPWVNVSQTELLQPAAGGANEIHAAESLANTEV